MELQFRLAEPDYVSANWIYLSRRPWQVLFGYRFPVGLAAVAALIVARNPERWQDVGRIFAVGIALIAYLFLAHRWHWHQNFQQQRLGETLIAAAIDADSVRFRGKTSEAVRTWAEFSYVYETRRIFMFGTVKGNVMYLPKAAMSQLQINELKALIAANARCKVRLAPSIAL